MSTRPARAVAVLTLVCAVWGSTFFLIKLSLRSIAASAGLAPEADAVWAALQALRFSLALPVLALMFPRGFARLGSPALWLDATRIALPTALGFGLQAAGLARVSPATSAFLTSLYMPLTPVAAWLLLRSRLPRGLTGAMALGLAGVWILALPGGEPEGTGAVFGTGEWLSAACGAAFALQIVAVDRAAPRHDSGSLTIALFLLLAFGFSLLCLAVPGGPTVLSATTLAGLASGPEHWFPILFIGTVASAFPLWAMNHYQKHLDPSHAATVYASEPVFAALFSAVFFGERFGLNAFLGGSLVIAANIRAGRWSVPASTTGPSSVPGPVPGTIEPVNR